MKGRLAFRTVILLVIAVIVIAIALYFLSFVEALEPFFFDEKMRLIKYSTCSLAMCANGIGSKQIDRVGCLNYEGGRCEDSCWRIANETNYTREPTFVDLGGVKHYCGEENAIEFEFKTGLPINLKSGQIQKLAKPRWACEGLYVPFWENVHIGSSEDWEKDAGDCVMSFIFKAKPDFKAFADLFENEPGFIGRECFDGFRAVTFTPLMPYNKPEDRVYPSALYLGQEFTSGNKPECELSTSGPVYTRTPADLASENTPGDTLKAFSQCTIKTADTTSKKKFKVWSEAVVNKPYITFRDDEQGRTTITEIILERVSEISKELYSKFNQCAVVVLSKQEKGLSLVSSGNKLTAPGNQIFPALVEYNGELYLYYQDSDDLDPSRMKESVINWDRSSDGIFTSLDAKPTQATYAQILKVIQPSVTVLNGHRYLATAADIAGWEIIVARLSDFSNHELWFSRVTNDEVNQFAPSIISLDSKLYLFYYIQAGTNFDIVYRIGTLSENEAVIEWSNDRAVPNLRGTERSFPSVTSTPEGLMLTYSFRHQEATIVDDSYYTSIGAAILKNDKWVDAGIVESGRLSRRVTETRGINNGFSKLLTRGNEIFVFFDQGSGTPDNPKEFERKVVYSTYLGNGRWSRPITIADNKDLMSSVTLFKNKIALAYSELGADFDLVTSISKDETIQEKSVTETQTSEQEIFESLTITSDKQSYNKGETIRFIGNLKMKSGTSEGKEVDIELKQKFEALGDVLLASQKVISQSDGSFVWEYTLPNSISSGNYEVTASYRDKESAFKFKVE